ncbi:hypothetical protein [Halegenticoccus soli]|uniref:hypothetical protein n=1 Tax=Halegenticoccus soli TaxID=1985678 RepID=UPI000C6E8384|nr:hypothetical protein [Halegenticoccus soli]
MRFKLVPEPPASVEVVAEARRAIPLVPGSEDDCTARLLRRLDLTSPDVARTWLTFLRALDLAERTPSGFRRTRTDPTPEHLRGAFRRRVFGADEALSALAEADGPRSVDEVYETFRDRVPTWEHYKNPSSWEEIWHDRIGRVLEWSVLLGLADRADGGYAAAGG